MKKLTIIIVIFICHTSCQAQTKNSESKFDYIPNFSAVVVSNLNASVQWYKSVFDLKTKNEMNDPNGSYKITILESPTYSLELLELRGSLMQKEILKGKPDDIKIQGHFKIGFKASDMDACLKHLSNLKVNVPQVWTDGTTKKRNFLISDPDGNLIQFYE
jgi:predicted enzyme related to lactoylglutathione lyase